MLRPANDNMGHRKAAPSTPGTRNIVAVDLGADSCRVSLARENEGGGTIQTVYRFPNGPVQRADHLYWDIENIVSGVGEGLRRCAALCDAPIRSVAVDGWAVDYVRLDRHGRPLNDPFCYRDPRTEQAQPLFWKNCLSRRRIYELTGIQMLRFNTVYQLYADARDDLPPGKPWLNIPEYVLHRLGGRAVAEYSNATHTQMLEAGEMRWCNEILSAAGFRRTSFPTIVAPGTILGKLLGSVAKLPQYADTLLIAPACHDTGSAVAGIPNEGTDDWAFLISGTWSLIGTVLPKPCTSRGALNSNFSNEGGLGGQVRFLKNVNGMWLLQQCMRQWQSQGRGWEISQLVHACSALAPPRIRLDVDDPELLLPGNMIRAINRVLAKNGHTGVPESSEHAPGVASLILHSLASRYAEVLQELSRTTCKKFRRLYVVGGGSRNEFLNGLIASKTGMAVIRGPVEASTVGNAAIQLAVLDGHTCVKSGVDPVAVSSWSRRINTSFGFRDCTTANANPAAATAR